MRTLFPVLDNIAPVLAAIVDFPEIAVRVDETHGYGYVMYNVAFEGTFADPLKANTDEEYLHRTLMRECRGIKYNVATGNIVSRPYHKFFNIAEKAETQPGLIDWKRPHVVLEKLDGSMLTPLISPNTGELVWMTKRGVTQVADTALQFLADNPMYVLFCKTMIRSGKTPIFEWCTRKQRIILDYGAQDRMVLTAIRDNRTGEYTGYEELVDEAINFSVDFVHKIEGTAEDITEFMKSSYALEDAEGYVVRFENGEMYKIKGEWYCQIHRTFDNLRFEKDVIRLILSEGLDDAKPFMVESLRENVDRFHKDMLVKLTENANAVWWVVQCKRDELNGSKKLFAKYVIEENPAYKGLLFDCWDYELTEEQTLERLIKTVIDATGSSSNVERVRYMFGELHWNDYLGDNPTEESDTSS